MSFFAQYFLLEIALLIIVVWMALVAWKSSPVMGFVTFFFPLAGAVSLFNGDKELRRAFLSFLVVAGLGFVLLFRAVGEVVETMDDAQDFYAFQEWESEEDRIEARIRWRRAVDRVSFQRGSVSLPVAHATIEVPEHFRFVNRLDAQRVYEAAGLWVDSGVQGWIVHETVDLSDPDAWFVAVVWDAEGHVDLEPLVNETASSLLGRAVWAANQSSAEDRQLGLPGYDFVGFTVEPAIDTDQQSVVWVEELDYDDEDQNLLDCYAIRLARRGLLTFQFEFGQPEQEELCLRSVRLMAARTEFDADHRYADYSFLFDADAPYDAAEMVASLPHLD